MTVLNEGQLLTYKNLQNENHTERIVQFLIGNEIELALEAFEKDKSPRVFAHEVDSLFFICFLKGLSILYYVRRKN